MKRRWLYLACFLIGVVTAGAIADALYWRNAVLHGDAVLTPRDIKNGRHQIDAEATGKFINKRSAIAVISRRTWLASGVGRKPIIGVLPNGQQVEFRNDNPDRTTDALNECRRYVGAKMIAAGGEIRCAPGRCKCLAFPGAWRSDGTLDLPNGVVLDVAILEKGKIRGMNDPTYH